MIKGSTELTIDLSNLIKMIDHKIDARNRHRQTENKSTSKIIETHTERKSESEWGKSILLDFQWAAISPL